MVANRGRYRGDQRILIEGSLIEPRSFLEATDVQSARSDIFRILSANQDEAPAILVAVRSGLIDGTRYEGACACLVGTIARLRGISYLELDPNSFSPAEKWFSAIDIGNTPRNSWISAITEKWVSEWISENSAGAQ